MKKAFIISLFVAVLPVYAQAASLPDFTGLVERYSPAVVNISATQAPPENGKRFPFNLPEGLEDYHQFGDLFERFFDRPPNFGEPDSLGSGFIISADGYIITNAHVVAGADEVLVRLYDRRELHAEVIGSDKKTDIALLKINATDLPTVKLGSSQDLKVGEWVMAIGNPFGFDHTVTAGIVSAKGRSFRDESYVSFLQTDVAINPGNSGGPLFNTRGEVVGVNSRISSEPGRRSYAGLSFAIPAEVAADVVQQIKTSGQVSWGWLGVYIQDVTPELAQAFNLDRPVGALVAQVIADSPAERSGIEVGDIILQVNKSQVKTSAGLPPLVGRLRAGETAHLTVMRDGDKRTIKVKIGELPATLVSGNPPELGNSFIGIGRLGIKVRDLDAQVKQELGVDYGVIIVEVSDDLGARFGLREGDIVQIIDGHKIQDVVEFKRIVKQLESGDSVAILVHRNSGPTYFALRVP